MVLLLRSCLHSYNEQTFRYIFKSALPLIVYSFRYAAAASEAVFLPFVLGMASLRAHSYAVRAARHGLIAPVCRRDIVSFFSR